MAIFSNTIVPSGVLTPTGSQTVTNKTINFGSNTIQGALAVVNGGTGVTTSTGTGNVVLSNSPTLSTNSTNAALTITQTGTGNALVVEDSVNPDATPFVIDTNGRAIVGSTTALTYSSALAITPALQINAAGPITSGISRFSADAAANSFWFLKSRGATVGTFNAVVSGDGLGTFGWIGTDGTDGIRAAEITAAVDGTPGTNDMPGRLVFSTTADGSATPTERMRISSSGNLGVGTGATSPELKFSVTGGATSGAVDKVAIFTGGLAGVAGSGSEIFLSAGAGSARAASIKGVNTGGANNAHAMVFSTSAGGALPTERMTIDSAGNINIPSLTASKPVFTDASDNLTSTGTVGVDNGGTGVQTLTGIVKGNGASAFTAAVAGTDYVAPGTATTFTVAQSFPDSGVLLKGSSTGYTTLTSANASATAYTVTIPAETMTVGYKNIPPVGTKAVSYTLAPADVGKYVQLTTGGSITIPDAIFAEGDVVSVFNNTAAAITITCTITTAYIAGTDADRATVSLAARGTATILFISGTICVISGNVS